MPRKSSVAILSGNIMTSKAQVRCKVIEATTLYQNFDCGHSSQRDLRHMKNIIRNTAKIIAV